MGGGVEKPKKPEESANEKSGNDGVELQFQPGWMIMRPATWNGSDRLEANRSRAAAARFLPDETAGIVAGMAVHESAGMPARCERGQWGGEDEGLPQLRVAPHAAAGLERQGEFVDLERDLQRQANMLPDYAEGVRAFMEKRKPNFTGRK